MSDHSAVQIIEHVSERRFKLKKHVVGSIYGDKRVANLPLVILCIAGAARKGKSFLLNFFLDYLIHRESNSDTPWELNESTQLEGFEFQDGIQRTTLGIWAWNHVFVIEEPGGIKIAVSLIDSQGTFDNTTSFEDCSTIFAMTCLLSSVMCFNVFNDLQEDKLNNFAVFVDHGKKINDNLGGSGKLFQDLVFIVRDCQFREFVKDKDGGKKYIETVLGPCDVAKLQEVRDTLNASYERKHCFVFPHPGEKVAYEKTSKIADMSPLFVENAVKTVISLFSNLALRKKKLGSTFIHCKDMTKYMEDCVHTFDNNKEFAPQAVQAVNRSFMCSLEETRAIKKYENLMNEAFIDCKNGFPLDFLKKIDETSCAKIEADIAKRIRDDDICAHLMKKFNENHYSIFEKYIEKNNYLIKERQQEEELVRQQVEYDAKLLREKAEREEQLRKQKIEALEKLAKTENEFDKKLRIAKEESVQKLQEQKKVNETKNAANQAKYEEMLRNEKKERDEQIRQQKIENEKAMEELREELEEAYLDREREADYRRLISQKEEEKSERDAASELERFKEDVKERIKQEISGYNRTKTFVTTPNYYHCCIYYNQGVSTTEIKLFYRRDGNLIYTLSEDYFFAFRGHRLEGMLKEMLKHSNDITATWHEAVSQC